MYTPGPWTVLTQGSGVSIVHIERHPDKTGGHRICRMHSGKANIHDDARLIAAAPDLLEALEWALATYENITSHDFTCGYDAEARQAMCAAIAKAKGEAT